MQQDDVMPRFRAVLFDMDGVLYNSMYYHARAWHAAMATFGIAMAEEEAFELEGMRGVDIVKMKVREQQHRELTPEEAQRMYDRKSDMVFTFGKIEKVAGVEQLMRQMHDDGLLIGVVTGSGQRSLFSRLKSDFPLLIEDRHIVTSYDVERGKPAPDPYIKGMEKVGTHPSETLVVENAPLGVRAAVAAGCYTIAVNTGPLQPRQLKAEGADCVFDDMTQALQWWNTTYNTL